MQGYGFSALFVAGLGFDSIPLGNGAYISYLTFATSGAMTFVIIEGARLAGTMVQTDRHSGMMKQILVMPFSQFDYIGGIIITSVLMSFMGALVLLVAGIPLLWGSVHYTFIGSLYMIYGIFTGCIIFASISIMLALLIKSNATYDLIVFTSLVFFVPSLSPTFYPLIPELPDVMKYAFYVVPATHVLDVVRAGMFDQVSATVNLQVIVLTVVTAAIFFVAVRLMLNDRRNYE
jgi:ABC-2 type transport system permease protein